MPLRTSEDVNQADAARTHHVGEADACAFDLGPRDNDLVQAYDAFTIEELEYCESLDVWQAGES